MEFKDRIKELRIAKNLTQQELADAVGLSLSIINKWENGKYFPSMQAIVLLSKYFNESTDYIIGVVD